MEEYMRVVFMGTPDFSVPALEKIADKHEVVAVVTQQDRPKGRGHKMQFTPVKEKAVELNIPVYQPEKVKNPEFVQVKRIKACCDCSNCIWTDSLKRNFGFTKIRLHKCSCIIAS